MEPNLILLSIATNLLPSILKKLASTIKSYQQDDAIIIEAIQTHLVSVTNWITTISIFGMSSPQLTENTTVALDLFTEPRRFQSSKNHAKKISENEILSLPTHVLLLGEPGSGKTTTFKRLALSVLREEQSNEDDFIQFPMVIRLRELQEGDDLLLQIANRFGLNAEPQEIIIYVDEYDAKGRLYKKEVKRTELRIGSKRIENVIPKFLNEGHVLLLLDGLDELRSTFRDRIRQEIIQLSRYLTTSKIIISCRSGDYTHQMDGFSVLEICPLSDDQIIAIKDKWLGSESEVGWV